MVSKASDDLPDPDSPVNTTSRSRGITRSTSFRLCSRAPRMTISVCWPGRGSASGMDPLSYPSLGPDQTCLGGGGWGQAFAIGHGIPPEPDQAIAQFRRALELEVASCLLHLPLQVLDQALDLV